LSEKSGNLIWNWDNIYEHWKNWFPQAPLGTSILWEAPFFPEGREDGALILHFSQGDDPDLIFLFHPQQNLEEVRHFFQVLQETQGRGWVFIPAQQDRDLWGYFGLGGQWWQMESHPFLQAFWCKKPSFLSSQDKDTFHRPFFWNGLGAKLPSKIKTQPLRWFAAGWQEITPSMVNFSWEGKVFFALPQYREFWESQGFSLQNTEEGGLGIEMIGELKGAHLPLVLKQGGTREQILENFWKNNLGKIKSRQFSIGGENLLEQTPWISTLLHFISLEDARNIVSFLLVPHHEVSRGGIGKLFFYKVPGPGGKKVFSTPFFNPRRMAMMLPPHQSISSRKLPLSLKECRRLNLELLEQLGEKDPLDLPLSPQAQALIQGMRAKIQHQWQKRIQALRAQGLPQKPFFAEDSLGREKHLYALKDRQIVLAFFSCDEAIWQKLRYSLSENRVRRIEEEKDYVSRELARGRSFLLETWEALLPFARLLNQQS